MFEFGFTFNILYKEFTPSKHGYLRVEEEINDLKKHNVPYFYSKMNDCNLYSNDRIICENYFQISPYENIQETLESFDHNMLEYQIHLIKLSLFTANKLEDDYIGGEKYNQIQNEENYNYNQFISDYVKKLISLEVPNRMNQTSTIYISQMKGKGRRILLDSVDSGLYIGGGIVYLMYNFAFSYNDMESKLLSKRMILGLYEGYVNHKYIAKEQLPYGIYEGYGGLIFITYNYYKLFDDLEIYSIFKTILEDMFAQYRETEFDKRIDADYVNGLGGTILFLSRIYEDCHSQEIKNSIKTFIKKFYEFIMKVDVNEVGLAHGISGKCMTLSIIHRILDMKEIKKDIINLLEKEDMLLKEIADQGNSKYSWCRGLTGVILATSIIKDNFNSKDLEYTYLRNRLDKYCTDENIEAIFSLGNPCLCHGFYGNLDALKYVNKTYEIV